MNQPIRVCFLIDRLDRAGTESQLLLLIENLDRAKIEPFLCLLDGTDSISQSLEPNCPILRLGIQKLASVSIFQAVYRFARFVRQNHIQILQTYFVDSTYFGVLFGKLLGIRPIIRVRNNLGYWLTPTHRRWMKWCGCWADWTFTNSEKAKQILIQQEPLLESKIYVIPNGIDLTRFADHPPPLSNPNRVHVGMVANLRPVKNIDLLIRAAVRCLTASHSIHFSIAGDGPLRDTFQSKIDAHAIGKRFQLLGSIMDIPSYLKSVDIAVLCSHSEGMSNAIMEYMASGRAIISTICGSIPHLIQHNQNGILIPKDDESALFQAIERYLQFPALAQSFGNQAKKRIESSYGVNAICRHMEEVYPTLYRNKKPPRYPKEV